MTIPNDNVIPLPQVADLLARQAREAMETYKSHKNGSVESVVAYGLALLKYREQFGEDDKAFGRWIAANGLNQGNPWKDRIERSVAMQIAKLLTVGSEPTVDFSECRNSLPTGIMKWYRKTTGQTPLEPERGAKEAIAYDAYDKAMQGGEPVSLKVLCNSLDGISYGAVQRAARRWDRDHADAPADALLENLSPSGKVKVEDAIRITKARLEKDFERRVGVTVRERLAEARQAQDELRKETREEVLHLRRVVGQKGVFFKDQLNLIRRCLHTDSRHSITNDDLNEALRLVNENKDKLLRT